MPDVEMSNADQTYLLTIARTLRDSVAPHVEARHARLVLLACQHMLMRLAHPISSSRQNPFPVEQLPQSLRDELSRCSPRPLAQQETPAENTAISPETARLIEVASTWIRSVSFSAEQRAAWTALADWEGALQDEAERLYEKLDVPQAHEIDAGVTCPPIFGPFETS
jgi:hypothetical protein